MTIHPNRAPLGESLLWPRARASGLGAASVRARTKKLPSRTRQNALKILQAAAGRRATSCSTLMLLVLLSDGATASRATILIISACASTWVSRYGKESGGVLLRNGKSSLNICLWVNPASAPHARFFLG